MADSERSAARVSLGVLGLLSLSVVAGVLIAATVVPAAAMTSTAATTAIDLFDNLPSALNIDKLILPSTIYAKNAAGTEVPMATYYDQNRDPVTWDQIAPVMFDAILSSEDPRFYDEGAIDPAGTVRALLSNLKGGSAVQGGSTISQQYVKNVLMEQCDWNAHTGEDFTKCWQQATDDSGVGGYQRKLQELRYSVALEQKYSKSDILLGYLNIVNFGGSTYGIDAAARHYFGIPASQLDLAQAATLAGMVQSPNVYRIDLTGGTTTDSAGKPVNGEADHYALTKKRQQYVLGQMLRYGKITRAQYNAVIDQPIAPHVTQTNTGCGNSQAPYFCAYVTDTILTSPAFGATAQARTELLHRGGLKIYTTLDPRLQAAAAAAQRRYAPPSVSGMDFGSTSVSVQASTGRVLAMAQNTDYVAGGQQTPGQTGIVYAGNTRVGGSVGFSPGSSFKLFTLLTWLENGHSVNEGVNGNRRVYTQWRDSCVPGGQLYTRTDIGNYNNEAGYYGTPMQFTAESLNSGYLGMASELDLCQIGQMASRLGVTLGNGKPVPLAGGKNPTPYEILGSDAISPLAMAAAYATVANHGVYCQPRVIDSVTDAQGQSLAVPQQACTQVIPPNIAATAAYALAGVMRGSGTGAPGNPDDGTPVIGKTGTQQDVQTWLITSNTAVTTANWVGNVNGTADLFYHYGYGIPLANVRYPLARAIQSEADILYPGRAFPAPDPALSGGPPPSLPYQGGTAPPSHTPTTKQTTRPTSPRQPPGHGGPQPPPVHPHG